MSGINATTSTGSITIATATSIGAGISIVSAGAGGASPGIGAAYSAPAFVAWTYDPARGLFYIETADGKIDTFDPIRKVASLLVDLGTPTHGLALSADGNALFVGQASAVADPAGGGVMDGVMDRISLSDLSVQKLTFQTDSLEQGPYSIAVGQTGLGFYTTNFAGSGSTPLRTFPTSGLGAGQTSGALNPTIVAADNSLPSIPYGPFLTLSEDGRYVLVAEQDTSYGILSLLNAATGAVLATTDQFALGTYGDVTEKTDVNGHAGLVAEINAAHVMVLDTSLHLVKDLSALQQNFDIIGLHFSQDGKALYLWSESQHALLVYDTGTWQQTGTIPVLTQVTGIVGNNDPTGQMSLGDNGRLLFLKTDNGFETVDLRPGWHADDFNGDGVSDFLIQGGSGAVVIGEIADGQASYQQVAALGSEWRFLGSGDFLNYGVSDYLIEDTAGDLVVGDVQQGRTSFTQVGAIGPEWTVQGVGHFLTGQGVDFIMENTAGAVVLGQVIGGHASYSQVGALGPEWSFKAVGDFQGHGVSDFLIENSAGAVVVGEIVGGQATYAQVASLGSEWHFLGAGNILGDGKSDFLIENAAGAVVAGEVVNGQAVFTQIAALGPEWSFVGAGDYLGEGHDQILIENTSGAVVVGDYANGQIHFTSVAALGSEWHFHP